MAGLGSILQNQIGNSGLNIPIVPDDKLLGKASLTRFGTWVYSDIILSLKPDIGEVDLGNPSVGNTLVTQINRTIQNATEENFLNGDPDSIRLQEALLKVDINKVMSQTVIAGRNDIVVEYLSKGSHIINCNFNIASSWANVMPEAGIKKMIRILESAEPLTVSCRFLNFFKVHRLVVLNYSMAQRAGYVNQQSGVFTAISVSDSDTIEAIIPSNNDNTLGIA